MLIGFRCRIVVAGAFLSLTILAGTMHESQAARKDRLKTHIFDDLITPSMLESAKPAPAPRTGGARFFSINGVLARLDGKAPSDQNVRVASTAGETVTSDAPGPIAGTVPVTQVSTEPFGLFTFKAPEGPLWRKWRALKADYDVEMRAVAACRSDPVACTPAASRFIAMTTEAKAHDGRARLETVNRLVNRAILYTSDLVQHGVLDVWSAPLASLRSGRGDCEDYAIAKYALLREAGIAEQDLRILLVRDRSVREDHAVLAVRDRDSWVILDNRRSALALDSEAGYLTPMYALNDNGISLFASPYLTQQLDRNGTAVLPAADGADAAEGGSSSAPLASFRIRDIVDPETPAASGSAGAEHPLLLRSSLPG
jgi:predicted transglutaminase-like cysteine proteinase